MNLCTLASLLSLSFSFTCVGVGVGVGVGVVSGGEEDMITLYTSSMLNVQCVSCICLVDVWILIQGVVLMLRWLDVDSERSLDYESVLKASNLSGKWTTRK